MTALATIAASSIQLVYAAYNVVETNKERCGALVQRCELLVSGLQYIQLESSDDTLASDRVERLQEWAATQYHGLIC